MENKDLLNPESENNKKEQGVENLQSGTGQDNTEKNSGEESENKTDETEKAESDNSQPEKAETPIEPVSDLQQPDDQDSKAAPEAEPESEIQSGAESNETQEEGGKAEVTKDDVEPAEKKADDKKREEAAVDQPISGQGKAVEEKSEEDEKEEEDLGEKYNTYSKDELVQAIEALVTHDDVSYIRKHIGFMKVAFRNHIKQENEKAYEQSIEKGEEEEQSEKPVDLLEERFNKAFSVYKKKKAVYDQAFEKQKQDNFAAKEQILDELRELIESEEELKKTYDVFKELQERWRGIGPVPQGSKNTLWNNYHFLVEKFFDKVKINKELRDLDLKKNLEIKTELCEKAEELLLEQSVNKSFRKLQKLHDAWKETGPVPKDKKDELWDRFKAASDALNDRRQGYYENLREEQKKNYAAKVVLCEKAEELATLTSESPRQWQETTDKVNELFRVWKTIGFAPPKVNDEVWVRFRTALDIFFKKKKAFFARYKEEQTENYNQKLNLCVQAEALKDSEDWKQTTDELIALQKQWKKIGPVPKKFSDKVWKRFRAACDEFFNRKADYFANIGEKQAENLAKKKELIQQVRSHQYSQDNNENLATLKEFQRQWMEIGHVPFKEKDNIQSEFRKAINEQFDKLNISRKAKSTLSFKNKVEKMKDSPNADNIIYKEKSFVANKINALKSDIQLWENNIGFFASSKKADVLKSEFESKIEKAKTDIAILEEKLRILHNNS